MSEHKLLSDAELAEIADYFTTPLSGLRSDMYANKLLSHIRAQAAEIERLRADGDLYREIRRLAIHYEEVQLACSTTESGWSWSVEVPPYHDPIGQGPGCEDAINNARANAEGR